MRKDSTIGDSEEQVIDGWEKVPTSFIQEYRVLAEICDSLSSGFILLNQHERVTYSNRSALRLLHIGNADLVAGQDFDVYEHLLSIAAEPQSARSELERLWHSVEDYSTDFALTRAAVRWLRVRAFPVRNHHGNLLGRGILFDDITLERTALEERSETLAIAAHELKTPLAIIKGCATTLLGSSTRWDPAVQREMLQMIDTQSDRLYDVLNTLLDVWRFDAGTQSLRLLQVQLTELLQHLVELWQRNIPGRSFLFNGDTDVPPVVCDPVRVEQVMNHLLNNAVAYSHAGSSIKVLLEVNDVEVRISVADEGIGIAAEHLDRIFDRFYRVDDKIEANSSGLGLASSRAAVRAHGGRIWADSQGLGQGSTFYFTFPLTSTVADTTAMASRSSSTTQSALLKHDQRVRVLLAESDPRLTRYLRANLEEQQYRVFTVSHGVQCLRQLDLEEPDIVLLSTHLSDMSGVELLQKLREFSQAPVIMLCNECDEDERVYLFDMGSDDLVVKPFGMKELLARIRALLRRQTPSSEQASRQSIFKTGDLVIDYAQHLVTVQNKQVQLSRTEYKLLSLLAQNVGMVVTHDILLEKVWGPGYHRDVDFIWVYISRLRRKVEADSRHPKYILTVPDVGYKLAKL